MPSRWNTRLARSIAVLGRRKPLTTLADARAYLLALPKERAARRQWEHAAGLLIAAAEGGDVVAVTDQLVLALMLDGCLDAGRTEIR